MNRYFYSYNCYCLEVPVFFPVTAVAQIQGFDPDVKVSKSFFELPKDYDRIEENYLGNEVREMLKVVKTKGEN